MIIIADGDAQPPPMSQLSSTRALLSPRRTTCRRRHYLTLGPSGQKRHPQRRPSFIGLETYGTKFIHDAKPTRRHSSRIVAAMLFTLTERGYHPYLGVRPRDFEPAHSAEEGSRARAWMNLKLERVLKFARFAFAALVPLALAIESRSLVFCSCLPELLLLSAASQFSCFPALCRSSQCLVSFLCCRLSVFISILVLIVLCGASVVKV